MEEIDLGERRDACVTPEPALVGGGDEAVGVLQALSRISYLDFMSHCRRVVLEFDMGLKLPGPRRLHPSQYGYFCTSETPTGSHIGITKNLSIFTAISNGMIPTKFVGMLYKRGFVIPTGDVTPRLIVNMVPVYVKKAIVGYNETPELFVEFLKALKGTGCLPPYSSCGFNRKGRFIFLYTDEGRPLRPLYRTSALAGSGVVASVKAATSWRDIVVGSLQEPAHVQLPSTQFIDVFTEGEPASLQNYIDRLKPHMGIVEYIDPYEHNECYVANQPEDMKPETTHMEIHASTILGLLGVMIPYANHNQSPRNQLSGSQSKQGLGMYATNWYNRYDNNAHVLCYGEAPLSRTLYQDYIGSGRMSYGHNIILALDICTGYNQEDGILINKTALERGLFRNMSYRSYEAYEEDDPRAKSKTRIGNPHNVPAWLDVNISTDYSKLDANGIVKPGSYVDENTAIVGRYIQLENGTIKDASVKPQVWTAGRVEDVVVMVGNNGLRLVKIRVVHDRSPELGDKFCLTADHDVLTDQGWVAITDINHGHHVAVYDEETRELFYQPPEEVVGFAHKTGEIYEFTMLGDYVLKVTADHRLYVSLDDDKTWGFATAKEVARQHKRIYMMAENKAVYQVKSIDIYEGNPYSETVHCLKVSTGIFVARAHGSAVGFLTGNSNRHGQKGTIGMMLRGRDMPRTVDGIVPDMIMNPHAIPSRMTIAQLLEQMLGKVAANVGAIGNATPFMNEGSPHEVLGQILEDLGMERTGNEILYDGQSGKQIEAAIFIGPLYSMRLKHMTEDKWNARGEGRKEQRTHQPTGGRGAQGGLKIGEMERDAIVAHGIGSFVKESMMERSDAASFVVCNGCGTIPIYNEGQNFYLCPLCEGPVKFVGDRPDNLEPIPPTRRSTVTYSKVEMPYASKLFLQEMDFFMNMGARLLTTKDVERLPAVADIEEETVAEAANIDAELPVRTYTEVYVPELRKEEVTPTIKEIESQVAQIEEQQKKIMEQEAELRRTREALDAGLLGNNVVIAEGQTLPGQTLQPNVNQTSVQTLPIQQNQTLAQTLPANVAPTQPTPIMPTQGMDIIPGEAPTIIVSTTEEDMVREGLGSKPTMPLGQPDVQQYEQPASAQALAQRSPLYQTSTL
jgi:DNA-directed RNA polymerase II subunit RPB2